jgi:hypothetical protein
VTMHPIASDRPSLRERLDALHDDYAEAINYAIAADDDACAATLAAQYDEDSVRLVAQHEGKAALLPELVPLLRAIAPGLSDADSRQPRNDWPATT